MNILEKLAHERKLIVNKALNNSLKHKKERLLRKSKPSAFIDYKIKYALQRIAYRHFQKNQFEIFDYVYNTIEHRLSIQYNNADYWEEFVMRDRI